MEEKPLVERLKQLEQATGIDKDKKVVSKELRIPRRAKVRKRRLKKGWIGILKVDNGNITGEKQQVEGSTIKLKDGTYHVCQEGESLLWGGKFPVVIQWKDKILNLNAIINNKDQTYGQKLIMARMLSDFITDKKRGGFGGLAVIGIVILVGYLIAHYGLHLLRHSTNIIGLSMEEVEI